MCDGRARGRRRGAGIVSFEEANAVVVGEVFGRLDAQSALPGLLEAVGRWEPDLVLRDPVEFGSLAAAEVARIPHVDVAIGVSATAAYVDSLLGEPLTELDVLAGLPAGTSGRAMASATTLTTVPAVLDHVLTTEDGDPTGPAVRRFCTALPWWATGVSAPP